MMPRAGGELCLIGPARFTLQKASFAGLVVLVVGFAAPVAAGALAFGVYLQTLAPGVSARRAVAFALVGT